MSWEYLHWGHFNKDQKCWWSLMFPLFLKEMTWHMHLSYTTMTNHKQQHCLSANGSPAYFASSRLCDWHLWNPQWFSRPGETFSRSSDDLFYMACTSSLFLQNLFLKVLLPACLSDQDFILRTHYAASLASCGAPYVSKFKSGHGHYVLLSQIRYLWQRPKCRSSELLKKISQILNNVFTFCWRFHNTGYVIVRLLQFIAAWHFLTALDHSWHNLQTCKFSMNFDFK